MARKGSLRYQLFQERLLSSKLLGELLQIDMACSLLRYKGPALLRFLIDDH